MSVLQYTFDDELTLEEQSHIKGVIDDAFRRGEIISCTCPAIEAWVYPTRKPDFQASLSCSCDVMRPLFSSTPETE
jgi:hypothetical protein